MRLPEDLKAQAMVELQNAERLVMQEEEEAWGMARGGMPVSQMLRSPSPSDDMAASRSGGRMTKLQEVPKYCSNYFTLSNLNPDNPNLNPNPNPNP